MSTSHKHGIYPVSPAGVSGTVGTVVLRSYDHGSYHDIYTVLPYIPVFKPGDHEHKRDKKL